ncbi:MAG: tyrosine-type recombinase/integrase [Pseudomonadota bacterium]
MAPPSRNPNHPKPGSSLKVEPVRDLAAIARIKAALDGKPRDYCFFVLGINSGFRAGELLSITVGQVRGLSVGDRFELKQSKNARYRAITVNGAIAGALVRCLAWHPAPSAGAPLFWSQKSRGALQVSTMTNGVKAWCAAAGLTGSYGSHTLRKTWGYHQRKTFGKALSLLTRAYGHTSEAQTLEYLCIQPEEIDELYSGEL